MIRACLLPYPNPRSPVKAFLKTLTKLVPLWEGHSCPDAVPSPAVPRVQRTLGPRPLRPGIHAGGSAPPSPASKGRSATGPAFAFPDT